jgi:hypothetical protein
LITIYYNLLEGAISVFFGFQDEALSLFGFGVDSFVEVIPGIGFWHKILGIRQYTDGKPDRFEKRALKITGTAFYLLARYLQQQHYTTSIQVIVRNPHSGESLFP